MAKSKAAPAPAPAPTSTSAPAPAPAPAPTPAPAPVSIIERYCRTRCMIPNESTIQPNAFHMSQMQTFATYQAAGSGRRRI